VPDSIAFCQSGEKEEQGRENILAGKDTGRKRYWYAKLMNGVRLFFGGMNILSCP
jgi:hypothetical protein